MTLFYILILMLLIGALAIAWILFAEKRKESPPEPKPATGPKISPKELIDRLGLENPPTSGNQPLIQEQKTPGPPQINSIANPPQIESELSLKYDELLMENTELKAKYAKIESLFAEKSSSLEKSEKALANEIKNQKEFNKVKDILEKEIKDSKDKISSLQSDLRSAQTDTQTQLKRVSQLEEKVKKLEVEILTSEAAINDAHALTQQARKHSSDLEEKLRLNETHILEKNQKIEDLVNRLKDLPSGNTKDNVMPEPPAIPTPAEPIVDEQGRAKPEEKTADANRGEPEIDEKSSPLNISAPDAVDLLSRQNSNNVIIEKNPDGALTLRPDILTNPPTDNQKQE